MIKYIEITNHRNETLKIDIYSHYDSGFNIRKITGLGPVKADITTTKMVTADGEVYNSARANSRNIVLTLGFVITPELGLKTIEDCRQLTYKYFPLKKKLKFSIVTDNRELYTYGYVESNEPDIFSKDETAQISIICPSSYFISNIEKIEIMKNVRPIFKFPFEVLEEDLEPIDIIERGQEYSEILITESGNGEQFYGNDAYNLYKNMSIYGDFIFSKYFKFGDMTYDDLKYYEKDMEVNE